MGDKIVHMIKYKKKYASLGFKDNTVLLPEGAIIIKTENGTRAMCNDFSISEPCLIITYLEPER